MRIGPLVSGFVGAVVLSALLAACGGDDSGLPTAPRAPLSAPVPARVEIAGPRSVAPGETAQFTMMLQLSDGSRRDVTTEATWQSRAPQVMSIGPGGLVTGLQPGDGSLYGFYRAEGALTANREVIVVPAGTYRLMGSVYESGEPAVPVTGAQVEVASASGALSSTTGDDGRFRFYGISGNTQVSVSKTGYEPTSLNLTVADHGVQNVELRLSSPRRDVSGTYTLTLTAADSCRGGLPDHALRRTYAAAIAQRGAHLEVRLSGARFVNNRSGRGSSFSGKVEPTQLRFTLNLQPYYNYYPYYPEYYPDIVEQLESGYLVVSGSVVAQSSGGVVSGLLNGSIAVWPLDPRTRQSPSASCMSPAHHFVLTR